MPQPRVTKGLALKLLLLAQLMVRVPYWLDVDVVVLNLKLWKRKLGPMLFMLKPLQLELGWCQALKLQLRKKSRVQWAWACMQQ